MPKLVSRCCAWCESPFTARAADVNRGWAKFCSKACKAKEQEARTGQYSTLLREGGGISRGEMYVISAGMGTGRSAYHDALTAQHPYDMDEQT